MDTLVQSHTARLEKAISEERISDSTRESLYNETKWEWSYLRRKCRNLELEQYYESYMNRLRLSYLSLFIFVNAFFAILHIIIMFVMHTDLRVTYVDIICYTLSVLLTWLVLAPNFREHLVQRKPWIMYVTSWMAIVVIVTTDLGVPVYHAVFNQYFLRTTYSTYSLYAVYTSLPLQNNVHAFLAGVAVTISYMINYNFITYRKVEHGEQVMDFNKVFSEVITLSTINIMGVYYRLMKEIAIRTTFLDRRQCVEENLLLRYARDQEKSLLLSIIPAQIANKIEQDVKMRIEQLKQQYQVRGSQQDQSATPPVKRWRQPNTEKLFIEPHNDVSILYADLVNFTKLTTSLDVRTLVETLHDLFVKFDTASEAYNVLRIKFLGDCYYCVAGVPVPNDRHAQCCTDLALRMISDIREVRLARHLDIDMRIGVHSGNILSGVIGACKWQFDIWSKDVDIANRLEQTGVAGRVHVSEQTLHLLEGEFLYEEGTEQARNDTVLRKYRIRTFLIIAPEVLRPPKQKRTMDKRRQTEHKKGEPGHNFMHNTIVQYSQIRTQAKLEMNREMDKMPIGRIQVARLCCGRNQRPTQDEIEEQNFRSNITTCCLFFKDWRWELAYLREPDVMLKYSLLISTLAFISIVTIQPINEPQPLKFWIMSSINFTMFIAVLFCAWYKRLWTLRSNWREDVKPTKFSEALCGISDKLQSNIIIRTIIYLMIISILSTTALLQMAYCDRVQAENMEIEIQLFEDGRRDNLCFNPWAVTESIILTVLLGFLFTRIPFVLKSSVGVLLYGIYSLIVLFEYDFIYEKSPTTNIGLITELAHLLVLSLTLVMFHLLDRQTEFISKVDYNWNRQLQKKQDDAKVTNETINILIKNILPSHVAEIYMTKKMRNELYFEEYDNVAVMFATIKNYNTEKVGLRVLNEIICDFDAVLNYYKGPLKIEKIKVAGWTYMAACGLDPSRSETNTAVPEMQRGSSSAPGRRSQYNAVNPKEAGATNPEENKAAAAEEAGPQRRSSAESVSPSILSTLNDVRRGRRSTYNKGADSNSVVLVLTNFALDLMRTMHIFNMENLQYVDADKDRAMLRIGISSGEVMAGVVGSYKPHYDIWGNPVNMASRMDTTGMPGNIQVTTETAQILKKFHIKCVYRGLTKVKGRGEIPTHFVGIDRDLNFIKDSDDTSTLYNPEFVPSRKED